MKQKETGETHLRFAVLATDVALFTLKDGALCVRLIRVHRPPHFPNMGGLPGGLILPKETAEEAVQRIVTAKASIRKGSFHPEQLYTFSTVDRDPRGRVVSVAYTALVPWESLTPTEQLDTKESWWAPVKNTRELAYDHDHMLNVAVERLRARITYTTLISKLMPKEFTLTDLESAYECILKTSIDKRNFRKKILKLNILKPLKKKRSGGAYRPAELYSFTDERVKDISIL